jgi:hypothetical protein
LEALSLARSVDEASLCKLLVWLAEPNLNGLEDPNRNCPIQAGLWQFGFSCPGQEKNLEGQRLNTTALGQCLLDITRLHWPATKSRMMFADSIIYPLSPTQSVLFIMSELRLQNSIVPK